MASSQTTNCLDFSALLNSIMMMHSMYSQGLQFYFLFQFCRKQNIFFHVCPFALTLVVKKIHFFLMLLMTHIGQSNFSLSLFLDCTEHKHTWLACNPTKYIQQLIFICSFKWQCYSWYLSPKRLNYLTLNAIQIRLVNVFKVIWEKGRS